ncbi:MAG: hypothetical protein KDC79_09095 [Cyclobacteriaceae bacterium]|nr:hypothetical protein [Cyclobacteriaceae bacterium]
MSLFVDEQNKVNEYTWLDVEWIEFNRFVGLYSLKLKSRKAILFTPYGTTWWIFGDMSEMGQIIERKKKELQL